jgi:hypothetical protein
MERLHSQGNIIILSPKSRWSYHRATPNHISEGTNISHLAELDCWIFLLHRKLVIPDFLQSLDLLTELATVNLLMYTMHQVVTEHTAIRFSVFYQFWHRDVYTHHFDRGSQNKRCCLFESAFSCFVALIGSSGNFKDRCTLERGR